MHEPLPIAELAGLLVAITGLLTVVLVQARKTAADVRSGRIVTTQVEEDDTLADMSAYAASTRPPAPGANPAACSDDRIRAAVAALSESQAR